MEQIQSNGIIRRNNASKSIQPKDRDLTPEQQARAQELAAQLVESSTTSVLAFGYEAQRETADITTTLLDRFVLQDSGSATTLLSVLTGVVSGADPEKLAGPQGKFSWVSRMLPWSPSTEKRVTDFIGGVQTAAPTVNRLEKLLALEREKARIALEQVEELAIRNLNTLDGLAIVHSALKQVQHDVIRRDPGMNELLDRRFRSIDLSFTGAGLNHAQFLLLQERYQREMDTLGAARTVLLPAWRTKMSIAITALRLDDQAEVESEFRKVSEGLVDESTSILKEVVVKRASLKKRATAAAKVVAGANGSIMRGMEKMIADQNESERNRQDGLSSLMESHKQLETVLERDHAAGTSGSQEGDLKKLDLASGVVNH